MRPLTRAILIAACAAIVAEGLVLWAATGRAGFTRFRDPDRASAPGAEPELGELFAGTGLEDETGAMPEVPNEFRLGLLPSGWDRHAVSVLTLAGPAALAILLLIAGPLGGAVRARVRGGRAGP